MADLNRLVNFVPDTRAHFDAQARAKSEHRREIALTAASRVYKGEIGGEVLALARAFESYLMTG